jgi:hypothetical protein
METFQKNKLSKELLWFVLTVIGSLLFWCALALIVNQNIIADEYLYDRERNGFLITIGIVYFVRLSARLI